MLAPFYPFVIINTIISSSLFFFFFFFFKKKSNEPVPRALTSGVARPFLSYDTLLGSGRVDAGTVWKYVLTALFCQDGCGKLCGEKQTEEEWGGGGGGGEKEKKKKRKRGEEGKEKKKTKEKKGLEKEKVKEEKTKQYLALKPPPLCVDKENM